MSQTTRISTVFGLSIAVAPGLGCYEGVNIEPGAAPGLDASGSSADAGSDAGSDSGDTGSDGGPGSDLPDAPAAETGWHRLSAPAYRNTVRDLLTYASDEAVGQETYAAVEAAIAWVPNDSDLTYDSHDQAMSQAHVDAYFDIGMRVGDEMTQTTARLTAYVGSCAVGPAEGAAACLDSFVDRFGALVHRAPLSEEEHAFYRDEVYSAGDEIDPGAIADLIAVMLSSPRFVYRVELGVPDLELTDELTALPLSEHELASRLSYLLWNSMPDPELLAAADEGLLSQSDRYAAEVDRLFTDERAQRALTGFFGRWLELEPINLVGAATDPAYAAMAGDALPSASLAEEMTQEVLDSIVYHVWTAEDDLAGWIASPYAFARSEELAAIYGVPTWEPGSEPPFAPAPRAGLVTRPAFLAATSMRSRPILRGSTIRRQLLCDALPPPPPDAQGAAGSPSPTDGARAWTEAVTQSPECSGCHVLLNPIGFALEGFDSLGRARDQERLFDANGALLASDPVDTTATVTIAGESREVTSAADLTDMLVETEAAGTCLAEEYFAFALGREVQPDTADEALLESLRNSISADEAMADVLEGIALHPSFRVRGWKGQ